MKPILFTLLTIVLLSGCHSSGQEEDPAVMAPITPAIKYKEVDYFLHDTTLFTEGLLLHDGQLYESTGSPDKGRKSLIGINDLKTGSFIKKVALPEDSLFGEGIVFFKDKLYQLTYKNHLGFIYDAKSFKKIGQFPIQKEGWGLTTDGASMIMSDGTDTLNYINNDNFSIYKKLAVTENGAKRDSLNELEYIKGYIYANIWQTNNIVKIDPADGKVVARLDLSPLAFKAALTNAAGDVLNGIAYDSTTDYIYVTGKLWPHIHQLKLTQPGEAKQE
ncbi:MULTISPECIES: glutaminyl-peptide cyclotransferase [Niastella]|uniref:Glutaminyl-peptide cyclotransferase n=1 Tax=Niastella soli TaxID=2821487 RepID=A0ABS3Z4S2_9BACT|nr:glutaminyl-peptide cyclotransferase [Niastella soli]MBO9205143.1 glutaminyl-peptide cyclotransferase [Niastella soli]